MPEREYSCESCMNRKTPLCELCTSVTHPSGKSSRPTLFVSGEGKENEFSREVASYIEAKLLLGAPIPVNWVLYYNFLLTNDTEEDHKNGKKKDVL